MTQDVHRMRTGLAVLGLAGALLLAGCARASQAGPGAAPTGASVSVSGSLPTDGSLVEAPSTSGGSAGGEDSVDPGAIMLPSGDLATTGAPTIDPAAVARLGELAGRSFVATDVQGFAPVTGEPITLTFRDGLVGADAGCNHLGGEADATGGVLRVPQLRSTAMGCSSPLGDQDVWLSALLSANPTWTLAGPTLVLSTDSGSVTFTEDTPDTSTVEGTGWRLSGLLVGGDAVGSVPEGVDAWMVLQDGRLMARTGCNSGSGAYTLSGTQLTVESFTVTEIGCTDAGVAEVERSMLQVLQGVSTVTPDGDQLTLTTTQAPNGLVFTADPSVLGGISEDGSASPTS